MEPVISCVVTLQRRHCDEFLANQCPEQAVEAAHAFSVNTLVLLTKGIHPPQPRASSMNIRVELEKENPPQSFSPFCSRSIDSKNQVEPNKNVVDVNTKVEQESALASQVRSQKKKKNYIYSSFSRGDRKCITYQVWLCWTAVNAWEPSGRFGFYTLLCHLGPNTCNSSISAQQTVY